MYASDSFPLGPNGQYPKQRISSAGNELVAPRDMEQTYLGSLHARLPVTEKDFNSSVARAQHRMKHGMPTRAMRHIDSFRPRYAQPFSLRKYK